MPVAPLPYSNYDSGPISRSMLGGPDLEDDAVRQFSGVSSTVGASRSLLEWKLRELVRDEEARSEAEDLGVLHSDSNMLSEPAAETLRVACAASSRGGVGKY